MGREPVDAARAEAASRVDLREVSGHTTIVALVGEHDLSTKARLLEELERARLASTVIVDLTRCTFIDSTIIESLLSARHARRVELALPARGSAVHRAVHVMGLSDFFTTHATLERALAATQPPRANV